MSKPRTTLLLAAAAAMVVATCPVFAQTTIDTRPAWDPSSFVEPFGPPDTQTYGQVVTAPPAEEALLSFAFLVNGNGGAITFRAEVYAWDAVNSRATGPALFESGSVATTTGGTFETFTFTIPGGLPVTPGSQYVLFVTTSKDVQVVGGGSWPAIFTNPYSGGGLVFINNGTDTAQWTTAQWNVSINMDTAFTATFGAPMAVGVIPTLSGWMLGVLAAALAAVAVFKLRA